MNYSDIEKLFDYNSPNEDQVTRMRGIRLKAQALALEILRSCSEGREKSMAITNLQSAFLWTKASISLEDRDEGVKNFSKPDVYASYSCGCKRIGPEGSVPSVCAVHGIGITPIPNPLPEPLPGVLDGFISHVTYSCGCKADGPGELPFKCSTHGNSAKEYLMKGSA